MIRASECIILTVEDARKILDAARTDWGRARITRLQKLDLFDAVSRLADLVRICEFREDE